MVPEQRPRVSKSWGYAYKLNPPQPEPPRFAKVKMLLLHEHLAHSNGHHNGHHFNVR